MTAFNVHSLRPSRLAHFRACGLALAMTGLMAAAGTALAATAPKTAPAPAAAASSPAPIAVSAIDFKRGDNGEGRLILRFSDKGAVPDLHNEGASVVVDVGNAALPANLQRPINVVDFATPVQRVDAHSVGNGSQLVLSTKGGFESLAYQTGNEYVVEIAPRAEQQPAAMGAAPAAAAAGSKPYTGRPVTFNFQDVPVRTVLQLIAEESGLNIVAADSVQGNVTLRLVNVPWDQAMDIVLRAKGLDKRRDGNVVWVAPQGELAKYEQDKEDARIALDNREDLITDYVQINYHNAADIYKELTEARGVGGGGGSSQGGDNGFLSPRGRLVADERTNTLMISDIPKKVARMRELIAVIDRPVDQVLIEGRIVIATDTFARDLGAKFGVSINNIDPATGKGDAYGSTTDGGAVAADNGLNVNLPAGTYTTGNAASIAYTLLKKSLNLDLELSAMQQEGRGEIVSNPRIVTANQREGVIRQGTQIPYITITGTTAGAAAVPNVQFKDALMELKVTPTITNDGRVFLNLNVTKNDVGQTVNLSGYGTVPTIDTREINTAVLVEDGQTVVIGGVYEFTDRESVSKVPFLGDIPFLGNLFKQKGRQKNKAELLIFVTPKVLSVAKR